MKHSSSEDISLSLSFTDVGMFLVIDDGGGGGGVAFPVDMRRSAVRFCVRLVLFSAEVQTHIQEVADLFIGFNAWLF